MKKVLDNLGSAAWKANEALAAAGVITVVSADSVLAICGLGGLAALGLSLRALSEKWNNDQVEETATKIDALLVRDQNDPETVRQLIALFDLPTDGNAANETPLTLLAYGLREEVRRSGCGKEDFDRLEVTTNQILTTVNETGRRVEELVDNNATLAATNQRLVNQSILSDEERRADKKLIAELEERLAQEAATGNEASREAIERVHQTNDPGEFLPLLLQRKKLAAADLVQINRDIAAIAYLRGDIPTAETALREILAGDPDDFDATNRLAHIHRLRGELQNAEQGYQRLLIIGAEDPSLQAIAYGNLGVIHKTRGNLDEAERMHKKSLAIEEELGRKEGMAIQYGNLGVIHKTRGDLDEAERMLKMSLAINEELGRKEGMASQYGNLGVIHKTRGNLDEAERMLKKSLAIEEELGRKEGMASDYGNLGLIHKTRGNLDEAERMLKKSLAINEELGRKEGMAIQYGNLGLIHQTRGNLDEARELWVRARDLFAEIGMPHMVEKQQGWIDELPDGDTSADTNAG